MKKKIIWIIIVLFLIGSGGMAKAQVVKKTIKDTPVVIEEEDEEEEEDYDDVEDDGDFEEEDDVPNILGEDEITVKLDGAFLQFDVSPVLKNDRTLVPFRAIFEALGATVDWDDATQTAIAVKGDTTLKITIGDNKLYRNGEVIELDVPAQILNDRTLVPVRAISESFGCEVNWVDQTQTVVIFSE